MVFENAIKFLAEIGFIDIILPFVLVFAIVFGVMEKSQPLGKNTRNHNLLVAFVAGFIIISIESYVGGINNFLAMFAMLIIVIVGIWLLSGALGVRPEQRWWLMLVMLVVVVYIALVAFGIDPLVYLAQIPTGVITTVVTIVAFVLLMYYITRSDRGQQVEKKKSKPKKEEPKSSQPEQQQEQTAPSPQPTAPGQPRPSGTPQSYEDLLNRFPGADQPPPKNL